MENVIQRARELIEKEISGYHEQVEQGRCEVFLDDLKTACFERMTFAYHLDLISREEWRSYLDRLGWPRSMGSGAGR
jgi:hypothetical protein